MLFAVWVVISNNWIDVENSMQHDELYFTPERFSRTELFIGKAAVDCLAASHVAIFGVGGVGGYAVEALVRAGIGTLTIVDGDCFSTNNINRQLHALDSTVGCSKVEVVRERCLAINPDVVVNACHCRYTNSSSDALLGVDFTYVIDCIDTITDKLDLICACRQQKLPVITSMGAANKIDPTLVRVGDLFSSEKCRLARIMRKELRRRGVCCSVEAVYSTEDYHRLEKRMMADGCVARSPVLGSIATIPSLFGLMLAGTIVQKLVEVCSGT